MAWLTLDFLEIGESPNAHDLRIPGCRHSFTWLRFAVFFAGRRALERGLGAAGPRAELRVCAILRMVFAID
jgi:hypothetical protein